MFVFKKKVSTLLDYENTKILKEILGIYINEQFSSR